MNNITVTYNEAEQTYSFEIIRGGQYFDTYTYSEDYVNELGGESAAIAEIIEDLED